MIPPTIIKPEPRLGQQPQPQQRQKATKVRRTRQPRNPQLSVARRNERERNRVKMVNNGFAMLRDHLPIEYLAACQGADLSDRESSTPDVSAKPVSGALKAKKFSKVETLRAAIQHIRMLEELMRSAEPAFESINIRPADQIQQQQQLAHDEEPLSVGEPLSCSSSSNSNSNSTSASQTAYTIAGPTQIYQSQPEQFVKLEPQQQLVQQVAFDHQLASPSSQASCSSGLHVQSPFQQSQMTQVHHQNQNQNQQPEQSHTHLWIQQHQSSFIEQQQQQQQYHHQQWYQQQQQEPQAETLKGNWQLGSVESPDPTGSQQMQQSTHFGQSQLDSPPIWYSSSPGGQQASSQPFGHHRHQISLYSQ